MGVRTRQLQRDFDYGNLVDNQLRSWNHIGLFSTHLVDLESYEAFPGLLDDSASAESRARAYLDVNCAHCHQESGPTNVMVDLRYDVAADSMNAFGVPPLGDDLGLENALLIRPGVKESSVLWERMRRLDATRMPSLGSTEVDAAAVQAVGEWIDASE